MSYTSIGLNAWFSGAPFGGTLASSGTRKDIGVANQVDVNENGIAEATEVALLQIGAGDFSGLTEYASNYLGPAVMYAGFGLTVIFGGYLIAHYLSKVISRPIRRRVDETLGKFVGKLVFYCILIGVTAAVLSKLGAPLGGLGRDAGCHWFRCRSGISGDVEQFCCWRLDVGLSSIQGR